MPPRTTTKLQRWLDLIHCLLAHRLPITFETIEREVPGYSGAAKAAQKRTFERDKDELRRLGIPIVTEGNEGANDTAYRLLSKDFYLPYLAVVSERGVSKPPPVGRDGYQGLDTLTFEADELGVIAEAGARALQLGDEYLASEARSALRKLAFDLPLDAARTEGSMTMVRPRANAVPELLADLHTALLGRKRVEITYNSMTAGETSTRTVEPYGLAFLSGHWYLVGRDVEQDAVRNFRANRVLKAKVNTARPNTRDYEIPASFKLREHAQVRAPWQLGDGEPLEAVVEFAPASGATRAAMALGTAVPDRTDQRRFEVRRSDVFSRWLLSFAGEARPVSPESLVREFIDLACATKELYARDTDASEPFSEVMAE